MNQRIVFVGGGNIATAMISGMLRQGFDAHLIEVLEPDTEARARLTSEWGVVCHSAEGPFLAQAGVVIWAIKPQSFRSATIDLRAQTQKALHLSVAAGVRSDSISSWLGNERIVRAMPNTPALIGKGISGLFARAAVDSNDRQLIERIVASTGEYLWLESESQLDAVTALSGSGPAYVFYFIEAMVTTGVSMGLTHAQAYKLAIATFVGAGELARNSNEPPDVLRQRVTSKGGTTHAAISSMEESGIKPLLSAAMFAAHRRAQEMGDEFGSI
jgi:pyrroline-5-carboxylate reductase